MTNTTTIQEKLTEIQKALKVPKSNRNNFGGYNYRSCEDILEAVKPLLGDCALTLSDELVLLGNNNPVVYQAKMKETTGTFVAGEQRFYIKATATLWHKGESITGSGFAREETDKKGMDGAQITGAASSYARKYALNGLFAIDDTKDADAENNHEQPEVYVGDDGLTHEPIQHQQPVTKPIQQPAQQTQKKPTQTCPIHQRIMYQYTKNGESWFSHKTESGTYCNGRPKTLPKPQPVQQAEEDFDISDIPDDLS